MKAENGQEQDPANYEAEEEERKGENYDAETDNNRAINGVEELLMIK